MTRYKLIILAALLLTAGGAGGQYRNYTLRCLAPLLESIDPNAPKTLQEALLAGPQRFAEPLAGVGAEAITFPISTKSEEAQQLFEQGVAFLHVLWYKEAERAFRTVVELDPDCPMGYWGLAQANERSPPRARIFVEAAQDRCDRNHPGIEQKWIALLANFYSDTDNADLADRSSDRIRALEELALDFSDQPEVRAFLIRRLTLDQFVAGLPVTSTLGVDTLAKEFTDDHPDHPSRHYRVFLWMQRRPDRLLGEAAKMIDLSPRAAEIWRYAAEAQLAAGRYAEAAVLAEAALRTDHRFLSEKNLMPWQAQNLTDNYEALVNLLTNAGRIDEAITWAKRASIMPRALVTNEAGTEQFWANTLMISGQWDRLLKDLEADPILRASDRARDRASRLEWAGIAHLALDQTEEAETAVEALSQLEREAVIAGISSFDENAIAESRRTLGAVRKLFSSDKTEDPAASLQNVALPLPAKARLYELSGRKGEAFQQVKAEIEANRYQWLPTAYFCKIAMETGHQREALFPINRQFRIDASLADPDLSELETLASLATQLRLPEEWTIPAPQTDLPEMADDPGPLTWQAPEAPGFELMDRLGETWTLNQFSGRPVLLNFFLGVQCAFCLQQFDTFQPYLSSFEEAGIEIVAISIDSTENLKQILGGEPDVAPDFRERFSFPVLADPELEIFRKYGVFDDFESGPMHATIFISPEGNILWRNVGHTPFEMPALLLEEAERLLKTQDSVLTQ